MGNRMYHIQNIAPIVHQIRQAQSVSTFRSAPAQNEVEGSRGHEVSNCPTNSMTHRSSYIKQEHVLYYNSIFGTVTLQKNSKYSKSLNASTEGNAPLINETAWTFRPSFISYSLQLRYVRSFGYISRSLNIYPVVSMDDPVIKMCRNGELLGLQAALSRKGVSPFVTDVDGWTLLHVSTEFIQHLVHDCILIDFSTLQLPTDRKYATGYCRWA